MTINESKDILRTAVRRDIIRAWSRPAPDVWYIDTSLGGCKQRDDAYVRDYTTGLRYMLGLGT